MNVTLNQVEVKKTVFVTINGTETRAKVLAKVEDKITVQLYDGNKLQKNADNTPIKTEVSLEDISLEKTVSNLSKTNTYDINKLILVEVEVEEMDESTFDTTETEVEVVASGVSYKEGMEIFKAVEGVDGEIVELVKTFDAKTKTEMETVSKKRVIGDAVVTKAKAVKAVYGLKIQVVGEEKATMVQENLDRKTALIEYKAAKESGKAGDQITMITISDATGKKVDKDTYPTFIVADPALAKKKNQWGVQINGETTIKDLTYNETRKKFTAIKKDETLEVGTLVQMVKLVNELGIEVNEMKYTFTMEIAEQNIEPLPADAQKIEDAKTEETVEQIDTDLESDENEEVDFELENEEVAA